MTGAPKIRAMELIREYETEPRGVYCGAIGHISPKGEALFNVAIRTPVIFRDGRGEMGIGSGVVYDSVGSKEYAECLLKMKFLTDPPKAFELIETLLHEPGSGYWLLDGHLARLEASARYFNYAFDRTAVMAELARAVEGKTAERLRVRMTLAENGTIQITTAPMPANATPPVMRYAVSETILDSSNPFLFHKTTRRELYDTEWQLYSEKLKSDEVIYLNERGELAEGSRTNIFVERNGKLLTPPLSSGLLPGVLRRDLIASGRAEEAVLRLEDLHRPTPYSSVTPCGGSSRRSRSERRKPKNKGAQWAPLQEITNSRKDLSQLRNEQLLLHCLLRRLARGHRSRFGCASLDSSENKHDRRNSDGGRKHDPALTAMDASFH